MLQLSNSLLIASLYSSVTRPGIGLRAWDV